PLVSSLSSRCSRRPRSPLFPYTTLFRSLLTIDVDPAGTGSGAAAEASVNGSSQQAAEEEMKPLVGSGAKETSSKRRRRKKTAGRSEEHTSELQSRENLVCRLLLEKKNDH